MGRRGNTVHGALITIFTVLYDRAVERAIKRIPNCTSDWTYACYRNSRVIERFANVSRNVVKIYCTFTRFFDSPISSPISLHLRAKFRASERKFALVARASSSRFAEFPEIGKLSTRFCRICSCDYLQYYYFQQSCAYQPWTRSRVLLISVSNSSESSSLRTANETAVVATW